VVDGSGRECGDVIDGRPAAVNEKPNLVRKGICNIDFLYLQH
jgi:hypothetical protein